MIYYISEKPTERFDVVPISYLMLREASTHLKLFNKIDPVVIELTEDAPIDFLPKSTKIPNLMIKLSDDTPITMQIVMCINAMFPQYAGMVTRAYLSDSEEGLRDTIKAVFASSYEFVKGANL